MRFRKIRKGDKHEHYSTKQWCDDATDGVRRIPSDRSAGIPKSVHAERIAQNSAVDDFELSPSDMVQIGALDTGKPLILDVPNVNEVYRLHNICFEQSYRRL